MDRLRDRAETKVVTGASGTPAIVFCDKCNSSIPEAERRYRLRGKVLCTHCAFALVGERLPAHGENRPVVRTSVGTKAHASVRRTPAAGKWRRYWARWIDWGVLAVVAPMLLVMFNLPYHLLAGLPPKAQEVVLSMVLLALYIPIEAGWLERYGTTPGKWLLGVSVTDRTGGRLGHATALRRSFHVWWRGCGCGFPPLFLVMALWSEHQFVRDGTTPWDSDCQARVNYTAISPLRHCLAIGVVIALAAVYGASNEF